jgi:hypothetical protein
MNVEVSVYRGNGKFFAAIGEEVLPVVQMIGPDGEETDDHDDAVVVVAGPDAEGLWVFIDLCSPTERHHDPRH